MVIDEKFSVRGNSKAVNGIVTVVAYPHLELPIRLVFEDAKGKRLHAKMTKADAQRLVSELKPHCE